MYDTAELFCVSVAEAQSLCVYPITSDWGALGTTNMGTVIPGRPNSVGFREKFIDEVKRLCANPSELAKESQVVCDRAEERFHPDVIAKIWENEVFV